MKISIAQITGSVLLTDLQRILFCTKMNWIVCMDLITNQLNWTVCMYLTNLSPFQYHFVVTLMICKDFFDQGVFLLYCDGVIYPAEKLNIMFCNVTEVVKFPIQNTKLCPVHVVTFTLISNLATDHIQKRRGEPGLFSFEYNLSPNLISK